MRIATTVAAIPTTVVAREPMTTEREPVSARWAKARSTRRVTGQTVPDGIKAVSVDPVALEVRRLAWEAKAV
eukprot:7640616-Pyramimonas_sp.AAC.1